MFTEYGKYDATGLAELVAKGEVTPEELLDEALARVAQHNQSSMHVTIEDASRTYPDASHFKFGDNEKLCMALLELVRLRAKTATCSALHDFEDGTEQMPEVGRRDIALDWGGHPALIIETVHLKICRFDDVYEDFALAEGENDDLAGWQRDHQTYFERTGGFSPDMKVVRERFRMVEDFGGCDQID